MKTFTLNELTTQYNLPADRVRRLLLAQRIQPTSTIAGVAHYGAQAIKAIEAAGHRRAILAIPAETSQWICS